MSQELTQQTNQTVVAVSNDEFRTKCQNFIKRLNNLPEAQSIGKTPDGKANTILISHLEMLLDEYFLGIWETENFRWSVITNEIVGSIDLIVLHPVTGMKIKRTGAAAIQIMVNKGSDPMQVQNKKANALDMGFPKLKAECIKNAANSLGKMFGRDLNRKESDTFTPIFKVDTTKQLENLKNVKNV